MEMISQLFCLKGKIQKEHFNDHPHQASTTGSRNGLFCFLLRSRLLYEILVPGVMIISYQKSFSQSCHEEPKANPRLLLISLDGDLKPISQATQNMYHCTYFKIMYIQNNSQGLIHVLGACEKIFNECVCQNCESQPIVYGYFLILYDPI